MQQSSEDKRSKNLLWQYAGFATQFLVAIFIALFAGKYVDKWIEASMPLMIWIFPLLLILFMLIKVIRDTGKKNRK